MGRISIKNPSSCNVNQEGVVAEKVGAKDRGGDRSKLEGPGEMTRTKL